MSIHQTFLAERMSYVQAGGIKVGVLGRKGWADCTLAWCKYVRDNPGVTPMLAMYANGQTIAKYALEPEFRALMDQADVVDADGQPLIWASRLLTKTPLPERVTNTDAFFDLAEMSNGTGFRFFFLGANQKNLEMAVARIRELYPNIVIAGYRNGYYKEHEEPGICAEIVRSKADFVYVGLGAPRQEAFMVRNRHNLIGVGWVKSCGGLFDYFTPQVKRAPKWMQTCGLEWLFRTIQEPRKYFWRYFTTNGVAAYLLLTRTRDIKK